LVKSCRTVLECRRALIVITVPPFVITSAVLTSRAKGRR